MRAQLYGRVEQIDIGRRTLIEENVTFGSGEVLYLANQHFEFAERGRLEPGGLMLKQINLQDVVKRIPLQLGETSATIRSDARGFLTLQFCAASQAAAKAAASSQSDLPVCLAIEFAGREFRKRGSDRRIFSSRAGPLQTGRSEYLRHARPRILFCDDDKV